MEWMLDIQLGRRNLSPIQRIAVAEKYRPIYEKKAKENQGARNDLKNNIPQNLGESEKKKAAKDREVNSKLAKVANVNPETYRQAKRVLDSENEKRKNNGSKLGGNVKNGNVPSLQLEGDHKKRNNYTDNQVAKKAGVGVGTVARFNKVMNSDDEVLLDLLESNIRRRGEVGGSAKKVGKRIKELERLYEIEHGGSRRNNCVLKTQEQLAKEMDMDVRTLQNYKILADMIPEVQDKDIWKLQQLTYT